MFDHPGGFRALTVKFGTQFSVSCPKMATCKANKSVLCHGINIAGMPSQVVFWGKEAPNGGWGY